MTSMTRWNPFKTLSRIDPFSDFEDFIANAAMRHSWNGAEIAPDIRIDFTEDDSTCSVKADTAGTKKDDIDVSINNNQTSVGTEPTGAPSDSKPPCCAIAPLD